MVSVNAYGYKFADEDNSSRDVLFHHLYLFEVLVPKSSTEGSYKLERSAAALALFDRKLRKTYPNSKSLPELPLQEVPQASLAKLTPGKRRGSSFTALVDEMSPVGRSSSSSSPSSSVSSSGGTRSSSVDLSALPTKTKDVSEYFTRLLVIPEIVTSDVLRCFLDVESPDGEMVDLVKLQNEVFTSVDILLSPPPEPASASYTTTNDTSSNNNSSSSTYTRKTVLKCHTITLSAKPSECVCWMFYTKTHDIGFSVDFNGKEGVKYERVNSQERTIKGMFQVPAGAAPINEIKVYFDNSYSKLRAKDLRFMCGIFTHQELSDAQNRAHALNEAKKRHTLLRMHLEEGLRELAQSITGQVHMDLMGRAGSGHSLAALLHSQNGDKEREEIERILDEKKSVMAAYEDTLMVLQEEKRTAAAALQSLEDATRAREALEEELLCANAEIEGHKERAQTAQSNLQANQESLMEALGHSKSSEEVELMLTRALQTKAEELVELRGDLEEARLAHGKMEETLAKTAAERKQLKAFGKTAKVELERLAATKKALEVEVDKQGRELSDYKEQLQEAHTELLRLQGVEAEKEERIKSLLRQMKQQHELASVAGTAAGVDDSIAEAGEEEEGEGDNDGGYKVDDDEDDDDDDGWQRRDSSFALPDGEGLPPMVDTMSLHETSSGTVLDGCNIHSSNHSGYNDQCSESAVYKDGQWIFIPPPKLTVPASFFGF